MVICASALMGGKPLFRLEVMGPDKYEFLCFVVLRSLSCYVFFLLWIESHATICCYCDAFLHDHRQIALINFLCVI